MCIRDSLSEHAGAHRIAAGQGDPGIVAQLLEAEGNPVAVAIKLENLDLDVVEMCIRDSAMAVMRRDQHLGG